MNDQTIGMSGYASLADYWQARYESEHRAAISIARALDQRTASLVSIIDGLRHDLAAPVIADAPKQATNDPSDPSRTDFDVRQIVYALERQEQSLQSNARRLAEASDYAADFPGADAERMREAILILNALPKVDAPSKVAPTLWVEPGHLCEVLKVASDSLPPYTVITRTKPLDDKDAPLYDQAALDAANRAFALVLLGAASKSGDSGAIALAAQLAGAAPCEACGFVAYRCRCLTSNATSPAPPLT